MKGFYNDYRGRNNLNLVSLCLRAYVCGAQTLYRAETLMKYCDLCVQGAVVQTSAVRVSSRGLEVVVQGTVDGQNPALPIIRNIP